jgi:hypothetical protein
VEQLAHVEEVFRGCDERVMPFYERLGWRRDDTPGMSYRDDS